MSVYREGGAGTLHLLGPIYREDSSGVLHALIAIYREDTSGNLHLVYRVADEAFNISEGLTLLEAVDITEVPRDTDKDAEDLFTVSESIATIKRIPVSEALTFLEEVSIDPFNRDRDKDASELFTVAEAITRDKRISISESVTFLEAVDITEVPRGDQKTANELFTVAESITLSITSAPAAPSNLVATPDSLQNIFQLDWTDNSTTEDDFEIHHSTDGINFSLYDTVPAQSGTGPYPTYVSNSLADGTHYWKVRACNTNGCSAFSNTDSGTLS